MRPLFFSLFFVFLLIPISFSQEPTDLYSRQNLLVSLDLNSSLDIFIKPTGEIKAVNATFGIVPPSDSRQKVLSVTTSPAAKETRNGYTYSWVNPTVSSLPFSLNAEIRTKIQTSLSTVLVQEKIPFPLVFNDTSAQEYLQETNMTDFSNPAVQNLANSLASGEDDAYVVAVKIADWVEHNISYNLTTQTIEAAEPASWVLENGYGVCDELTNLYIALLRSVGIPARFVVGVAYTNYPFFLTPWSPHGWAEVYFPDHGWVPFDITYGEYGFLDVTHIKLHHALDANQAGVSYTWVGRDAFVTNPGITIDASVLEAGSTAELPVSLSLSSLHTAVGFGSSTLILATLQNNASYYVPLHLTFATAPELSVEGPLQPTILLGPKETKFAYWIVTFPQLDPSYKYSFHAVVSIFTNQTASTSFTASAYDPVYNFTLLDPLLRLYTQKDKRLYTSQISLNCNVPSAFYPENAPLVSCLVVNQGTSTQHLSACLETDCTSFFLNIGSSDSLFFNLSDITVGPHVTSVIVSNNNVLRVAPITYSVLDIPTFEIINNTFPSEVFYGEKIPASFVLSKTSFQNPSNLSVMIYYDSKQQFAAFPLLADSQHLDFFFDSSALRHEYSTLLTVINYTDAFGNTYQKQESTTVTLAELSFRQKVKLYFFDVLGV